MTDELRWGVKTSLMRYVRSLPDGVIETSDGAEIGEADVFRFPFVERGRDGVLRYAGRLHWSGYGGLMDAELSSPWIALGPEPMLSFDVRLPDMPLERWTIATVDVAEVSPGVWEGTRVRLTADGALTLGALQYHEYQQVDDIAFSAP